MSISEEGDYVHFSRAVVNTIIAASFAAITSLIIKYIENFVLVRTHNWSLLTLINGGLTGMVRFKLFGLRYQNIQSDFTCPLCFEKTFKCGFCSKLCFDNAFFVNICNDPTCRLPFALAVTPCTHGEQQLQVLWLE